MEQLKYEFTAQAGRRVQGKPFSLTGVVSSGNLEVLMEAVPLGGKCEFAVSTVAQGFGEVWKAVIADFMERNKPSDLRVSINDNGASPAVVSLRLDQTFEALTGV